MGCYPLDNVNKPSCLTRLESGAHYPQEYGRVFNSVEMRSIDTLQPHQAKPVWAEKVVPNRTRPKSGVRATTLFKYIYVKCYLNRLTTPVAK